MRRKALIVAVGRAGGARRIVSAQRKLVKKLKAAGESTVEAEQTLGTFVSALQHLEDHKHRVVENRKVVKLQGRGRAKRSTRDDKVAEYWV